MSVKKTRIKVYDMTCTSCEKRVENAIMKLYGVVSAKASYSGQYVDVEFDCDLCTLDSIKAAVKDAGYGTEKKFNYNIIGIAVIGIIMLLLGSSTGGFDMGEKLSNASYIVLFVVGVLTSIHCVGMCGGIMLSQSISEGGRENRLKSIMPAIQYNAGRVISYTILGGIVGALGSVFSLSIGFRAMLQIGAGVFMVIMGLNMAGFGLFRKIHIRLPWASCSAGKKNRKPFVVGLLNGLMPCGPLQTMQLYALGTGSAAKGAISMFLFALGTVPLMLTFGAVSGLLSKGYTKSILKFSGVLVIVLGLIMGTRGLALSGINVTALAAPLTNSKTLAGNSGSQIIKPVIKDGVQEINMTADGRGYSPNVLYVQKGMPARLIVNGEQITYCNNAIVIPSLNIQKKLSKGENIIEFTPEGKDLSFSCWMGMIRGVIKVVDDVNNISPEDAVNDIPSSGTPSCCSGPVPPSQPSIYGDDLSQVATDRIVKKADVNESVQNITFKGSGYEFDPLIIIVKKDVKTVINIDLNSFDDPEGKYEIVSAETGDTVGSFDGRKGAVNTEYTFNKTGGYGILKDDTVLGVIEVVDDVKTADAESIRAKYLR